MNTLQLKLFETGVVYYCVNPECFSPEDHMWKANEIAWKNRWLPSKGQVELMPFCPMCASEMIWEESDLGVKSSDYDNHRE